MDISKAYRCSYIPHPHRTHCIIARHDTTHHTGSKALYDCPSDSDSSSGSATPSSNSEPSLSSSGGVVIDDGSGGIVSSVTGGGSAATAASTFSDSDSETEWADASDTMQPHMFTNGGSAGRGAGGGSSAAGASHSSGESSSDDSLPSTPNRIANVHNTTTATATSSVSTASLAEDSPEEHHQDDPSNINAAAADAASMTAETKIEAVLPQSLQMAVEATKILMHANGKHSAQVLQYFDLLAGQFDKLGMRQHGLEINGESQVLRPPKEAAVSGLNGTDGWTGSAVGPISKALCDVAASCSVPAVREEIFWLLRKGASTVTTALTHAVTAADAVSATVAAWGVVGLCDAVAGTGAELAPSVAVDLLGSTVVTDPELLLRGADLFGQLLAVELRRAVVGVFVTAARHTSSCSVGIGPTDADTANGDGDADSATSVDNGGGEGGGHAVPDAAEAVGGAADEINSAVSSIAGAWSLFLDPLTGTDPWTGTDLQQQPSPPRPTGQKKHQTRREAARFFTSACLAHVSTIVHGVTGPRGMRPAVDAAVVVAVAVTRCRVAEYMALSSISGSEAASASIIIESELENASTDPHSLVRVLEAAGVLGARYEACRPPVLRFLAAFLTAPAIVLQIAPGGVQACPVVSKELTSACVESLVKVSLSSGDAEQQKTVAIEVVGSLTTAIVLSRHEESPALILARSNVVEALGMIAERLFQHDLDLVGTSAALLGQQLFNPPSPLDSQIVLKLGRLGVISSAGTFKAICEQLLQIVSHLLEHLAAQRASTEPRLRTRTLTTEQGGAGRGSRVPGSRVGSYPDERSGLTSANVPELLRVLPTAIATLATRIQDSTSSDSVGGDCAQQRRWIQDQLVVLFVNFGTRALDYNARKAQQWGSAISDLASTLSFPKVTSTCSTSSDSCSGATYTNTNADTDATIITENAVNNAVHTVTHVINDTTESVASVDRHATLALTMLWSLLTALDVDTETSTASSAGFRSLASDTPSLANIQPDQLFGMAYVAGVVGGGSSVGVGGNATSPNGAAGNSDFSGFVQIGPAVQEKLGARAYDKLVEMLGSSATPHLKALDNAATIYFAAVLTLESQRCVANGTGFAGMMQYLGRWADSGSALTVLSMVADVIFEQFLARELQRTSTAGQEAMLQTLAITFFAYFNDVAGAVKEASDRYLVGLLNAFPFLFFSQRVLVAILDLLNRLSASMASQHAAKFGVQHAPNTQGADNALIIDVQLPTVPEEYSTMVTTFKLKCEEYIQQSTAFAGRTAYSILQAYTSSIDFNFTGSGHAGVELAMKILLTGSSQTPNPHGGGEAGGRGGGHPLAQFGTGVALQSRLAAEMSVLVGEHSTESLAALGNKLAMNVSNASARRHGSGAAADRGVEGDIGNSHSSSSTGANASGAGGAGRRGGTLPPDQMLIQPLLRLVALTIATDRPPSAWIRAIGSAPVAATSAEPMVAGTFAWRWLLSKRPLLAADLLAEISAAIARAFATQRQLLRRKTTLATNVAKGSWWESAPAVKTTAAAEWPALELFGFLESKFTSGNKGRRDKSFVYCKIAWDTLNAITAISVGLDLHVRYAGLAYILAVLQSRMPRPLPFDERCRRTQLYDAALMSFAARLPSPRLQTLWRDVAAMVHFWKLLAADKPFCKLLDSGADVGDADGCSAETHSGRIKGWGGGSGFGGGVGGGSSRIESGYDDDYPSLSRKRALLLILVRDEIFRYAAWGAPQGDADITCAVEAAAAGLSEIPKTVNTPTDENVRVAWMLDPTLAVFVVRRFYGSGPWQTPKPAAVTALVSMVAQFPDAVAACPDAVEFTNIREPKGGVSGGAAASGGQNGGAASGGVDRLAAAREIIRSWGVDQVQGFNAQCLLSWSAVPAPQALLFVHDSNGHPAVLQYAGMIIEALPPRAILVLIPQLVQLLQLDTDRVWARLLARLASRSRRVQQQLFWHLCPKAESGHVAAGNIRAAAQYVVDSFEDRDRQKLEGDWDAFERVCTLRSKFWKSDASVASTWSSGTSGREIREVNDAVDGLQGAALPCTPLSATTVEAVERHSFCNETHASLDLVLERADKHRRDSAREIKSCLFTRGLDLLPEMVVMQIVTVLESVFEGANLNAPVLTATIVSSGTSLGLVGLSPGAQRVGAVGVEGDGAGSDSANGGGRGGIGGSGRRRNLGAASSVGGTGGRGIGSHGGGGGGGGGSGTTGGGVRSVNSFLVNRHRNESPEVYRKALETSVRSFAACSVVLHLLNLKPPTLENLWIDREGRLGMLGFQSMFLPEGWAENKTGSTWVVPEVDLNIPDLFLATLGIDAVGDSSSSAGGVGGAGLFKLCVDTMVRAFLAARLRMDQWWPLVVLMSNGDLAHFRPQRVDVLRARLYPGKTDTEAAALLRTKVLKLGLFD